MESIDIDRLRRDLIAFFEGAFFTLHYGAAIVERWKIEEATDEEIISIALENGFDLSLYIKEDTHFRHF